MLTFIKNKALQKTIEDSIEYMNILFDSSKDSQNQSFKEETYRVIILYVTAVIEAILLHILKQRGDRIITTTYKHPHELPEKIKHLDYKKEKLVTAIQCKVAKKDHQIGLHDLVSFMIQNKLMSKKTADEILSINSIRNTFHLSKSRSNITVELEKVEKAFSLLFHIIKRAPQALQKPI